MSFESTIDIFDAPVSCEQPTAFEWAEIDIPDALIDCLEADRCPGAPTMQATGTAGPGCVGSKRHAVVGADALRQANCFEHAREHWFGLRSARQWQGLAVEEKTAVALGDSQRIAVAAVTSFEVAFEVGAPHIVGSTHVTAGLARMPNRSSPCVADAIALPGLAGRA